MEAITSIAEHSRVSCARAVFIEFSLTHHSRMGIYSTLTDCETNGLEGLRVEIISCIKNWQSCIARHNIAWLK